MKSREEMLIEAARLGVPLITAETLVNYVHHKIPTGGFLDAFLCNNLMGALSRADDQNAAALVAIAAFVKWSIPSACWGSNEKVEAWLAR